jgi:hypothetical protein
MRRFIMGAGLAWFLGCAALTAQSSTVLRGPMLDAHNCYPEKGQWADRLARALRTPHRPIGIELDLVWKPDGHGGGVPVVGHEPRLDGTEPTLEDHFFKAVAPAIEASLEVDARDTWPLIVVHFDFKTNEREHHLAVLQLLGRYRRWLTTAPRSAGDHPQAMVRGPLLVLTEAGEGQERDFSTTLPDGQPLVIFGTVPPARLIDSADREAQLNAAADATPEALVPTGATNYRRWANFPWAVIERGGQARAGPWEPGDAARLRAVVDRGHALGLWMRFYTLDGFATGTGHGWTEDYNLGSLEAVRERWQAVIAAGVEFVVSDQYEEVGRLLSRPPR